MNNFSIGDRMKSFYEEKSQISLIRKIPVIIRLDGRSFHTFCKRFEKPYDILLNECLNNVLKYLCENERSSWANPLFQM